MLTLTCITRIIIDFYIILFLLNIWIQLVSCTMQHSSFINFIYKMTNPIIGYVNNVIPFFASRYSSFLIMFFLSVIKFPLLTFFEMQTFVFSSIYFLVGFLVIIKIFGIILLWLLVLRSFLTWIHQENKSTLELIFFQLTEPIINLLRMMFPLIYGIDVSIIVLIFLIYVLNYLGMDLFPGIWCRL